VATQPLEPNVSEESSHFAHEHNRRAWDGMVRERQRFTLPARDEDFANPLKTLDALGWLGGDIRGRRVLCLAAGGGKHGPLYAAAGADVTVVDLSPAMLELDRRVAAERKLHLRTVEASMTELSAFAPGEFDLVVHPVSSCYTPDIELTYRQVARVTRLLGVYISQHKQPASLQADVKPSSRGYELTEPYYRRGPLPQVAGSVHREEGAMEYLHRWEQLIGGLCRAGFVVEDLIEPVHAAPGAEPGSFAHRSTFVAPYVRILARRTEPKNTDGAPVGLWSPS
jgi:SAM-dependent methyltransferase